MGHEAPPVAVTEPSPDRPPPRATERRTAGRAIDVLCAVVLPAALVAGIYLFPYLQDPDTMPFGGDTAGYIGRVTLVHDLGLPALDDLEHFLSYRPAYPAILATLSDLTAASGLELAWVMPAVLCAAIALAAGALAVGGLGEPPRRAVAYGIGVGGSGFVAWTASGYATNLMLDPIALALVLAAVLVGLEGRSGVAGVLLGVAAVLIHWMFAVLFMGLVFAIGLALLLAGWVLPEASPLRPPPRAGVRVLTMLAALIAAGLLSLGLAPGVTDRLVPHVNPARTKPTQRIAQRLPAMRLPFTLTASAIAVILGLRAGSPTRRWSVIALGIWALLVPVAFAGWYWFGFRMPPYRSAAVALAVPLLTVFAAAVVGDLIARRAGAPGRVARVALLVVAVVLLAQAGAATWNRLEPKLSAAELAQYGTVSDYYAGLPPDTPIVLITSPGADPRPTRVWAGLSAPAILAVSVLPTAIDLSAPDLGIAAPPDAVVVAMDALDPRTSRLPGLALSEDVVLLRGPAPVEPVVAGTPPRAPGLVPSSILVVGILLLLGAAGSGWAGLLGHDLILRCTLAPAFGLAIIGVASTLASRIGVGFGVPTSVLLVAGCVGLGWTADIVLHRHRHRPRHRPSR